MSLIHLGYYQNLFSRTAMLMAGWQRNEYVGKDGSDERGFVRIGMTLVIVAQMVFGWLAQSAHGELSHPRNAATVIADGSI